VVRYDVKAGERSLDLLRWGLVHHWAKDLNVGFANINAKAEWIENRPDFRDAFQRRRCIVPVDNFYEWARTANGKQPYAVALAGRGAHGLGRFVGELALAGGRVGPHLRHYHHPAERIVRAATQPHGGGPQTRSLAARGTRRTG
jgi:hypothetical protein